MSRVPLSTTEAYLMLHRDVEDAADDEAYSLVQAMPTYIQAIARLAGDATELSGSRFDAAKKHAKPSRVLENRLIDNLVDRHPTADSAEIANIVVPIVEFVQNDPDDPDCAARVLKRVQRIHAAKRGQ